jgi:fermentation-respiration switch protein FrsA (DUF1100 family)
MLTAIVVTAVGLYLLFAAVVYYGQNRLIFLPSRTIDLTPDQVGLAYEEVVINVVLNEKIHAWYFRPRPENRGGRTILFCHGNAGNMSHRLQTVRFFLDLGTDVLLFDYRGYGRSGGTPTEDNVYADALAAYHWLTTERAVVPEGVFLFGRSLGGAVAIDLASRVKCGGVIVESAFTSAIDMGRKLYPFMPIRLLARVSLDSRSKIRSLTCPVLIAHSPEDEIVPYEMGRALYAAAGSKKLFVDLDGRHNDLSSLDNDLYRKAVGEFLGQESSRSPGFGSDTVSN